MDVEMTLYEFTTGSHQPFSKLCCRSPSYFLVSGNEYAGVGYVLLANLAEKGAQCFVLIFVDAMKKAPLLK